MRIAALLLASSLILPAASFAADGANSQGGFKPQVQKVQRDAA